MTATIKAVAYYRMSSDKQEASIADQRSAVVKFATDRGYKIICEYMDAGISGWKAEQRIGFQQLIADAPRGEFQAVLCWDQDRFSRFDPIEASYYFHILRKAGVKIVTLAQGELDFDAEFGWLTVGVVQHGKAAYCRDLARNTTRGLRKRKLAGQWTGGVPLGYQMNGDGYLKLGDSDEVALVRRIFDLRAKGYGLHAIAKMLNADGVTSPRGSLWRASAISAVLMRPAYRGDSVIGLHSRAKFERLTPDPVTIKGTHPAIIDQATWDRVQTIPTMGLRANGRNGSEGAPLSGLLFCGRCNSPMHAQTLRNCKYYLCSKYHAGHGCGHCHVERDSLLRAVASKLRARLLMESPEKLERAIQDELDQRRAPAANRSAVQRKLAKLDSQIERAARRMLAVDDSIAGDVEKQLVALRRERDSLAATSDQDPPKPLPSAKAIAAKIWELDRILCEASPTAVRTALRQIVSSIRLDFEPAGQTGRGRRFRFTGGVMRLCSGEYKPSAVCGG